MKQFVLPVYEQGLGRLRGTFVYMFICWDETPKEGPAWLKIGASQAPWLRVQQLRNEAPATPRELATLEIPSRRLAFRVETALHCALDAWNAAVGPEWFCVPMRERREFNAAWRAVLGDLHWQSTAVPPASRNRERMREAQRAEVLLATAARLRNESAIN